MNKILKQCIFSIVGFFILAVGIVDIINASCAAKLNILVWSRIVPGIILIIIGAIFIKFGKQAASEVYEDDKSISQIQIKSCEYIGTGLLYIIYFFRCLFTLLISQTTYILGALYNTPAEIRKTVMDTSIETLFLNIPITIVYVLCILLGIYLVVRGKKGFFDKQKDNI
ncbi:hypothetical protein Cpap_2118 [Ruminiclostridium papyrosolvens DSM 2782]|uniref:Uncharacterized protein n=1 Tax=Ruminiclostridium papyrosolvens DSM 2782 TaxID=588581 RepID=F1TCJ8_9FIRM|nr:hypothetical protein [Ruminiclostridium papyrosolvens]EGD47715.1 hypothetical protein Cpap_2118 [Ruminiclostridium papyrosolvens DSM 2782]WES34433.1 hypothetical protein P0092_00200 [Ruminiclostridium papyrosolvens DSM 2782]